MEKYILERLVLKAVILIKKKDIEHIFSLYDNINNNIIVNLRSANGTQVINWIYYLFDLPFFETQVVCSREISNYSVIFSIYYIIDSYLFWFFLMTVLYY